MHLPDIHTLYEYNYWANHKLLDVVETLTEEQFTKDSGSVEPIPSRADLATPENDARREQLHRRFNTRFMSGW